MKRHWEPREATPPPPTISRISGNVENRRSRSESSRSNNRTSSSLRRSRSPRRKKSLSPVSSRRFVDKRPPSRGDRNDKIGPIKKRGRLTSENRSKSPHRRIARDKGSLYSGTSSKDVTFEGASSSRIESRNERLRSRDDYVLDRPLFRGPEKDIILGRDSLKKIVVNMRDTPVENDTIKREIVNPEDITVVRRAGEGSRPIFDRDEIKNSGRKIEEDEVEPRRIYSNSPPRSDRRPSSNDRFRSQNSYYEEDRNARTRDVSGPRFSSRDRDSQSYDRRREERSRYSRRSRSHDRTRGYGPERRDRYEERDHRRSSTRGRSGGRSFRRHPSPAEYRRSSGRRLRSSERGDLDVAVPRHRDQELPPEGEYSGSDYVREGHGYYEGDAVEGRVQSPRGSSRSGTFRGRIAGRPLVRPGEVVIRGAPPVRPVRAVFIPKVPAIARRLPFPPRLIRPIVRPVIRVFAPVIPVRSPSVIPVRHPVIPLPFQCEAFR